MLPSSEDRAIGVHPLQSRQSILNIFVSLSFVQPGQFIRQLLQSLELDLQVVTVNSLRDTATTSRSSSLRCGRDEELALASISSLLRSTYTKRRREYSFQKSSQYLIYNSLSILVLRFPDHHSCSKSKCNNRQSNADRY